MNELKKYLDFYNGFVFTTDRQIRDFANYSLAMYNDKNINSKMTDSNKSKISNSINNIISSMNGAYTSVDSDIQTILSEFTTVYNSSSGESLEEIQAIVTNIKTDITTLENNINLKKTQTYLLAELYRKLRAKEPVKIICRGDSLTYGYDGVSSDKKAASTDMDDLGNTPTETSYRASITYPEALSNYLNAIFPDKIEVINHGFSGDTAKNSWQRWFKDIDADIELIMLGTNDTRVTTIEEFIKYYRLIIERNLLQNTPMILLTPPRKLNSAGMGDTNEYVNAEKTDIYGNAIFTLGKEYGIPVVDMSEMLTNYNYDIFSDTTHFNGKGYTILASRVASLFLGEGVLNPRTVTSGTALGVKPNYDNVILVNATFQSSGGIATPSEAESGKGINIAIPNGGEVIYSFYNSTENLLAIPTIFFNSASASVSISLDFETEIPDTNIDYSLLSATNKIDYRPTNPVTIAKDDSNWGISKNVYCMAGITDIDAAKGILMTTKGWHSLRIKAIGGSVSLLGIDFISYLDLYSKIEGIKTGQYIVYTHRTYTDTTDVPTTTINLTDLFSALKYKAQSEYTKNAPLKITVFNFDVCILEYYITINPAGTCKLCKNYNQYNLIDSPTNFRELDSIARSSTDLILTWKTRINRLTTIIISNV